MRAKRSKKYRKIMEQYALTFGFREPYQVLVDSNHLRSLHTFKMPLQRYLENTLHGKVKPFITKCTLAAILQTTDLHTSQRPDFLPPPTELPLRHCTHAGVDGEGEVLLEETCLLDLLGGGVTGNQQRKNKQHFVLATADPSRVKNDQGRQSEKGGKLVDASADEDIRAHAREIPGVPIIYVKRSVMILEELSNASLGVRRREEKDKFREGLLGLGSRKRKRNESDEGVDNDEKETEDVDAVATKKKRTRKVRGPNPLSVLKKKPKLKVQKPRASTDAPTPTISPKVNGTSTETAHPKAKRRQKHHKKRDSGDGREGVAQHEKTELSIGTSGADEG